MKSLRHKIQLTFFAAIIILVYVFKFNVEAYCPFGAVETMYTYFSEGKMLCALGSGNLFALISIVILTVFFRRFFCGYICPIGAVSEFLRTLAADFKFKQLQVPPKLDRWLSMIKYLMVPLVLVMTAATVNLFYRNISPCYLMASINDDIVFSTYVVGFIVLVASFIISMPFCRWICPFAAIQNVFSKFGFARITRDTESCINCGKCSKSCPMNIDVANQKAVTSANCISCFECVDVCPVDSEGRAKVLQWKFFDRVNITHLKPVLVATILICVIATAGASLLIDFPTFSYIRDIPRPDSTEKIVLQIQGVTCSGSAQLFAYFLDRKDISEVEGYLKVTTRPRPGWIDATILFDPAKTNEQAIIEAVTEAYYDESEQRWRPSPFRIRGVDIFEQ